jgi:hypothetical protein
MKGDAYLHVEHTGEKLQKTIASEVSMVAKKEALVTTSHPNKRLLSTAPKSDDLIRT